MQSRRFCAPPGNRLASAVALVMLALGTASCLRANPLRAGEPNAAEHATDATAIAPATAEATPSVAAQPATASSTDAAYDSTADLKLPPSRPTRVQVDVEMIEISQIQDHDQKFDVEFTAYFVWRDPRLAFDATAGGVHKKVMAADSLWTPDPLLVDELDVDAKGGATVHVHPDGTVHMNRYYRGTVAGHFDLHEFPLDKHNLNIDLEATGYEASEVVFVPGDVQTQGADHAVPHGWKLQGVSSAASETRYDRLGETYSRMRVSVAVARDPHYYFWSIVLPLIPIVATAWSVFWMDPKEFSSQVGVGITAMLTVVAYRITIDSSLPPLTYMTRMDYFLLVCQTFVFVAFVATVAIHVLYALDDPYMRARADRVALTCRWLPPILLTVISLLLAFLPVRYGTYVVLAPAVLLIAWLRVPLLRLPGWIKKMVHPESLVSSVRNVAPVEPPPAPHAPFSESDATAAESRKTRRRSA